MPPAACLLSAPVPFIHMTFEVGKQTTLGWHHWTHLVSPVQKTSIASMQISLERTRESQEFVLHAHGWHAAP